MPELPTVNCPWVNHRSGPHVHSAHVFTFPSHYYPETGGRIQCPGISRDEAQKTVRLGQTIKTLEV